MLTFLKFAKCPASSLLIVGLLLKILDKRALEFKQTVIFSLKQTQFFISKVS